ncbi:unnamed protein product [Protopolystoma xenopodis]|uniref:Uncharacterized protein n=1 Tax=Protopolystoma xenopodis TaxID=117903 RepID=A0A448WAD0_9PLAT|nr:unnamed protein product [Protopolystoma xenopodis]
MFLSRRRLSSIIFEVSDNKNLHELWTPELFKRNGTAGTNISLDDHELPGLEFVSDGVIRISLNRQLCPQRVSELIELGGFRLTGGRIRRLRHDEDKLLQHTNGDLALC